MDFWTQFEIAYTYIWEILDTQMTFGGVSFSFGDVLIVSGLCSVIAGIVWGIVEDV